MKTEDECRKFFTHIRSLYRTTLTQEEAEDGWVDIIMMDMHGVPSFFMPILSSTKFEFAWRMDMMGLSFHNMDKTIAAIDSFTNPVKIGRVPDVNDNL